MTRRFWRGFATGAASGAGAAIGTMLLMNIVRGKRRIVRLEKSIQIGRPVEEVFRYWRDLEHLPQISECIRDVRSHGNRSHWVVSVDGRTMEWDAEIEQIIPHQSIGWKSVNGPKHTGRISFSRIGNDTLVLITMNYAPPARVLRPFVANMSELLEAYIEQVLRDFKASLEGKGQEGRSPAVRSSSEQVGPGTNMTQTDVSRATGTYGSAAAPADTAVDRFGNRANPVEYTAPPDAKR